MSRRPLRAIGSGPMKETADHDARGLPKHSPWWCQELDDAPSDDDVIQIMESLRLGLEASKPIPNQTRRRS